METLTPAVFHILIALSDGERHGYAIMREVAADTGNTFIMGPGTLYGTLKRMLDSGLIEESGERPDPAVNGERRRHYRITAAGKRAAIEETGRLDTLLRAAKAKSLLIPSAAEQG